MTGKDGSKYLFAPHDYKVQFTKHRSWLHRWFRKYEHRPWYPRLNASVRTGVVVFGSAVFALHPDTRNFLPVPYLYVVLIIMLIGMNAGSSIRNAFYFTIACVASSVATAINFMIGDMDNVLSVVLLCATTWIGLYLFGPAPNPMQVKIFVAFNALFIISCYRAGSGWAYLWDLNSSIMMAYVFVLAGILLPVPITASGNMHIATHRMMSSLARLFYILNKAFLCQVDASELLVAHAQAQAQAQAQVNANVPGSMVPPMDASTSTEPASPARLGAAAKAGGTGGYMYTTSPTGAGYGIARVASVPRRMAVPPVQALPSQYALAPEQSGAGDYSTQSVATSTEAMYMHPYSYSQPPTLARMGSPVAAGVDASAGFGAAVGVGVGGDTLSVLAPPTQGVALPALLPLPSISALAAAAATEQQRAGAPVMGVRANLGAEEGVHVAYAPAGLSIPRPGSGADSIHPQSSVGSQGSIPAGLASLDMAAQGQAPLSLPRNGSAHSSLVASNGPGISPSQSRLALAVMDNAAGITGVVPGNVVFPQALHAQHPSHSHGSYPLLTPAALANTHGDNSFLHASNVDDLDDSDLSGDSDSAWDSDTELGSLVQAPLVSAAAGVSVMSVRKLRKQQRRALRAAARANAASRATADSTVPADVDSQHTSVPMPHAHAERDADTSRNDNASTGLDMDPLPAPPVPPAAASLHSPYFSPASPYPAPFSVRVQGEYELQSLLSGQPASGVSASQHAFPHIHAHTSARAHTQTQPTSAPGGAGGDYAALPRDADAADAAEGPAPAFTQLYLVEANLLIEDIQRDLLEVSSQMNDLKWESTSYRGMVKMLCCWLDRSGRHAGRTEMDWDLFQLNADTAPPARVDGGAATDSAPEQPRAVPNIYNVHRPDALAPSFCSSRQVPLAPYSPESAQAFVNEASYLLSNARGMVRSLEGMSQMGASGILLQELYAVNTAEEMVRVTRSVRDLVTNAVNKNSALEVVDTPFLHHLFDGDAMELGDTTQALWHPTGPAGTSVPAASHAHAHAHLYGDGNAVAVPVETDAEPLPRAGLSAADGAADTADTPPVALPIAPPGPLHSVFARLAFKLYLNKVRRGRVMPQWAMCPLLPVAVPVGPLSRLSTTTSDQPSAPSSPALSASSSFASPQSPLVPGLSIAVPVPPTAAHLAPLPPIRGQAQLAAHAQRDVPVLVPLPAAGSLPGNLSPTLNPRPAFPSPALFPLLSTSPVPTSPMPGTPATAFPSAAFLTHPSALALPLHLQPSAAQAAHATPTPTLTSVPAVIPPIAMLPPAVLGTAPGTAVPTRRARAQTTWTPTPWDVDADAAPTDLAGLRAAMRPETAAEAEAEADVEVEVNDEESVNADTGAVYGEDAVASNTSRHGPYASPPTLPSLPAPSPAYLHSDYSHAHAHAHAHAQAQSQAQAQAQAQAHSPVPAALPFLHFPACACGASVPYGLDCSCTDALRFVPGSYAEATHACYTMWKRYSAVRHHIFFSDHQRVQQQQHQQQQQQQQQQQRQAYAAYGAAYTGAPLAAPPQPPQPAVATDAATDTVADGPLPMDHLSLTFDMNDVVTINHFFFNYDRFLARMLHRLLPSVFPHLYPVSSLTTTMPPELALPDDAFTPVPAAMPLPHQLPAPVMPLPHQLPPHHMQPQSQPPQQLGATLATFSVLPGPYGCPAPTASATAPAHSLAHTGTPVLPADSFHASAHAPLAAPPAVPQLPPAAARPDAFVPSTSTSSLPPQPAAPRPVFSLSLARPALAPAHFTQPPILTAANLDIFYPYAISQPLAFLKDLFTEPPPPPASSVRVDATTGALIRRTNGQDVPEADKYKYYDEDEAQGAQRGGFASIPSFGDIHAAHAHAHSGDTLPATGAPAAASPATHAPAPAPAPAYALNSGASAPHAMDDALQYARVSAAVSAGLNAIEEDRPVNQVPEIAALFRDNSEPQIPATEDALSSISLTIPASSPNAGLSPAVSSPHSTDTTQVRASLLAPEAPDDETDVAETLLAPRKRTTFAQRLCRSYQKHIAPTPADIDRYKMITKRMLAVFLASLFTFIPSTLATNSTQWVALTAGLVFHENTGSSLQIVRDRIQGTVLGGFCGYAIVVITKSISRSEGSVNAEGNVVYTQTAVFVCSMMVALWTILWAFQKNRVTGHYSSMVTILTTMLISIGYSEGADSDYYLVQRIAMTMLGAACVLFVSLVCWPQNAYYLSLRRIAAALKDISTLLDLNFHFTHLSLRSASSLSTHVFGPSLLPAVMPHQHALLTTASYGAQTHTQAPTSDTMGHTLGLNLPSLTNTVRLSLPPFLSPFAPSSPLRELFQAVFPTTSVPRATLAFQETYRKTMSAKFAAVRGVLAAQRALAVDSRAEDTYLGGRRADLLIAVIEQQGNLVRVLSRMHECMVLHQIVLAKLPKVTHVDRAAHTIAATHEHQGHAQTFQTIYAHQHHPPGGYSDRSYHNPYADTAMGAAWEAGVARAQRDMHREFGTLCLRACAGVRDLMASVAEQVRAHTTHTTLGVPVAVWSERRRRGYREHRDAAPGDERYGAGEAHRARRRAHVQEKVWVGSCFDVRCGPCCATEVDLEDPTPRAPSASAVPGAAQMHTQAAGAAEADARLRQRDHEVWARERADISRLCATLSRLLRVHERACQLRIAGTAAGGVAVFPSLVLVTEHAFVFSLQSLCDVLVQLALATRALTIADA